MLWDNGDTDGTDGYSHVQASANSGSRRALLDDFVVPGGATWSVTGFSWLLLWTSGGLYEGTGAEILFRADSAGSPGAVFATATVTGWSEVTTGRNWFSRPEERVQATFNTITLGPGTYWVEFLPIGPENSFCMVRSAITGSPCWVNYDDYSGLAPGSSVFEVSADLSWQLLGTAVQQGYDLGFMDDYGRSQVCVNSSTGAWQWTVLKGNGAGNVYTGAGTVMNGSGYMRVMAAAASGYGLNFIYYSTVHRATGSFSYRPDAVSSALYDANTTDDVTTCGGGTLPPPIN